MTDKKNDGPAFPFNEKEGDGTHYHSHAGMTLRDYIAAKAMQGFCAHPSAFAPNGLNGWALVNTDEARLSDYCYCIADAMLAARSAS
jgi:hypothetical protein